MKLQLSAAWYAKAIENEEPLSVTAGRSPLSFFLAEGLSHSAATSNPPDSEPVEALSCKGQRASEEFALLAKRD